MLVAIAVIVVQVLLKVLFTEPLQLE